MCSDLSGLLLVKLTTTGGFSTKTNKEITQDVIEDNNASQQAGRWVDSLFAPVDTKPIERIRSAARKWFLANTLNWCHDDGARLIPGNKYTEIEGQITTFAAELSTLSGQNLREYDGLIERARAHRGDLFNAADYPSADEFARAFDISISAAPVPDPRHVDTITGVEKAVIEEIKRNVETKANDAHQEAMDDLFKRLVAPVKALARKAQDMQTGNGRRTSKTIISNIKAVAEIAEGLNYTGDPALKRVIEELKPLTRINFEDLQKGAGEETQREIEEQANAALKAIFQQADDIGQTKPKGLVPTPTPSRQEGDNGGAVDPAPRNVSLLATLKV